MKKIFLAAFLALAVAGCGGGTTTGSLLPSIPNPISNNNIQQLKLAYKLALTLSDDYRNFCYKYTYAQIMANPVVKPVCENRRAVLRQIQKYRPPAGKAVRYAADFVAKNPTIDAFSVIGPAWDAVTKFQNIIPRVPAT